MTQSVCILGRQPALGLAELESLYGADKIQPLQGAALLDINPHEVIFNRLGGTVKIAKLLTSLKTTEWVYIMKYLTDTLPKHLHFIPEGKIRFGLSVYGLNVKPATLNRSGLEIKKVIRNNGRSVRIVPNTTAELNAAQVIHNQLTGPTGMELILIRQGQRTLLAQTIKVQDITAYAARDQARPKRDTRVGMLPPKLAQIIINLAGKHVIPDNSRLNEDRAGGIARLLDPFCGTGVILQEAALMGYGIYGTDLEQRMVDYTQTNLDWLAARLNFKLSNFQISQADATNYHWEKPFDILATETYLGRPFTDLPRPDVLNEVVRDVDTIHCKFLKNLYMQVEPGFRFCLAVPAWRTRNGFKHLPVLDRLTDMGYNRLSFVHVHNEDLIYHRENQVVGRELVVLVRN